MTFWLRLYSRFYFFFFYAKGIESGGEKILADSPTSAFWRSWPREKKPFARARSRGVRPLQLGMVRTASPPGRSSSVQVSASSPWAALK